MPNNSSHLAQYQKNKELLSVEEMAIDTTRHLDWVITIVFYCAVHLVESELAKKPFCSNDHRERLEEIKKTSTLQPILNEYHTLFHASKKVRYLCFNYVKKDARRFYSLLEKIANHLKIG